MDAAKQSPAQPVRAAQYVRMSRESQRLSIRMQTTANTAYAEEHGFEIVATYADPGVSGLTIDRRPGLQKLLVDVVSGSPGFQSVLVYDVSRWGRFQDPDESAHYEFLCRSAGLSVHYTTEIFANDQSLASTLVKHLKRVMAAEFSRDLSEKIRRVHTQLHVQGYFSGGSVPYGLQRLQVGPADVPPRILGRGEKKSYTGSRIVLAPGPHHEVAIVRRIFRDFVRRERSTAQIVRDLNAKPDSLRRGRPWTTSIVRTLLANEAYCGTAVLGKELYHLNRWVGHAAPSTWRRRANAFPAIVSAPTWAKAQTFLGLGQNRFVSAAVLLRDLHRLRAKHGHLSADVIAGSDGYPVGVYRRVFGSLTEAYLRAGLGTSLQDCRARLRAARPIESYHRNPVASDEALLEKLRTVYRREGRLSSWIIDHASDCPNVAVYRIHFGGMRRAYALAGYQPSHYQDLQMAARGQPYSPAEASRICLLVRGAASAEQIRAADADALRRSRES